MTKVVNLNVPNHKQNEERELELLKLVSKLTMLTYLGTLKDKRAIYETNMELEKGIGRTLTGEMKELDARGKDFLGKAITQVEKEMGELNEIIKDNHVIGDKDNPGMGNLYQHSIKEFNVHLQVLGSYLNQLTEAEQKQDKETIDNLSRRIRFMLFSNSNSIATSLLFRAIGIVDKHTPIPVEKIKEINSLGELNYYYRNLMEYLSKFFDEHMEDEKLQEERSYLNQYFKVLSTGDM